MQQQFSSTAVQKIVKTVKRVQAMGDNYTTTKRPATPRSVSTTTSKGEFQHQGNFMVSNNQSGWSFARMHGLP